MKRRKGKGGEGLRKAFSVILSLALVCGCGVPSAAFASDQQSSAPAASLAAGSGLTARAPGMGKS